MSGFASVLCGGSRSGFVADASSSNIFASSSLLHLADRARHAGHTPSPSPGRSIGLEGHIVHGPEGDREDVEGVFERSRPLGVRFEVHIVKVCAKTVLAQPRALMMSRRQSKVSRVSMPSISPFSSSSRSRVLSSRPRYAPTRNQMRRIRLKPPFLVFVSSSLVFGERSTRPSTRPTSRAVPP